MLALLVLTAAPAPAGTMSASATALAVTGDDIANYGAVTGTDKWWAENSITTGGAHGQTPSLSGTARRPARFRRGAVKSDFLAGGGRTAPAQPG